MQYDACFLPAAPANAVCTGCTSARFSIEHFLCIRFYACLCHAVQIMRGWRDSHTAGKILCIYKIILCFTDLPASLMGGRALSPLYSLPQNCCLLITIYNSLEWLLSLTSGMGVYTLGDGLILPTTRWDACVRHSLISLSLIASVLLLPLEVGDGYISWEEVPTPLYDSTPALFLSFHFSLRALCSLLSSGVSVTYFLEYLFSSLWGCRSRVSLGSGYRATYLFLPLSHCSIEPGRMG